MSESGVSQTVKNLEAAFAGESMANRRYLYFFQAVPCQGCR
jgi:rubrerythrin